jgi:hypothetical protein
MKKSLFFIIVGQICPVISASESRVLLVWLMALGCLLGNLNYGYSQTESAPNPANQAQDKPLVTPFDDSQPVIDKQAGDQIKTADKAEIQKPEMKVPVGNEAQPKPAVDPEAPPQNSPANETASEVHAEPLVYLLNGPENPLKYWHFYSADAKVRRDETFKIGVNGDPNEPILICVGKPFGYLRTVEIYQDYDFGFEWKYAKDPNGNSGVLIHTADDEKIWPKAIQIQLHRPTGGSIFPSGGAKSDTTLKLDHSLKGKESPIKEEGWNSCVISSYQGRVGVTINQKKQGEISGCDPSSGHIALQSEGAEIHFRKIWIRKHKASHFADESTVIEAPIKVSPNLNNDATGPGMNLRTPLIKKEPATSSDLKHAPLISQKKTRKQSSIQLSPRMSKHLKHHLSIIYGHDQESLREYPCESHEMHRDSGREIQRENHRENHRETKRDLSHYPLHVSHMVDLQKCQNPGAIRGFSN